MRPRELGAAVVVFCVVLGAVLGGAALAGVTAGGDTSRVSHDVPGEFQPGAMLVDETDDEGEVTAPEGSKTVVVDTTRSGAGVAAVRPLVDALLEAGHTVETYDGSGLNATLRDADALVVAPAGGYATGEARGVDAFADAGGRVLVAGDHRGGSPTTLGVELGFAFGDGYLYNMYENANNFRSVYASPTDETTLTAGVDRVVLRTAVPVTTTGEGSIVTGERTRLSTSRRAGAYTVAARSGSAVTVGDLDVFGPANAYAADNEVLLSNLAAFLVNGEKAPGAPGERDAV
jgi:hypothetical protein